MKTFLQTFMHDHYSVHTLKLLITIWCLITIVVTWSIDNALILAGILAYEVLP